MLAHFDEPCRTRQESGPESVAAYFAHIGDAWSSLGVNSTRMAFTTKNGQLDARATLTLALEIQAKTGAQSKSLTFELVRAGEQWHMTDAYFGEPRPPAAMPPSLTFDADPQRKA